MDSVKLIEKDVSQALDVSVSVDTALQKRFGLIH